jgi:TolA-binding protein
VLLRAAALAKAAGKPAKAVELYERVHTEMPGHPKAPMALFMSGFVYENDLGDLQKAKSVYERFLQEYPNDQDFADDAGSALKLLGKSPEEIVREFEKIQSGKSE